MNSREKGYRGELELVHVLRAHGWPLAQRTSDGRVQALRGDVENGPLDVHLEMKTGQLKLSEALDQIARDADPLNLAVLVHKPHRHPLLAITYLDALLPLLKALGR